MSALSSEPELPEQSPCRSTGRSRGPDSFAGSFRATIAPLHYTPYTKAIHNSLDPQTELHHLSSLHASSSLDFGQFADGASRHEPRSRAIGTRIRVKGGRPSSRIDRRTSPSSWPSWLGFALACARFGGHPMLGSCRICGGSNCRRKHETTAEEERPRCLGPRSGSWGRNRRWSCRAWGRAWRIHRGRKRCFDFLPWSREGRVLGSMRWRRFGCSLRIRPRIQHWSSGAS